MSVLYAEHLNKSITVYVSVKTVKHECGKKKVFFIFYKVVPMIIVDIYI